MPGSIEMVATGTGSSVLSFLFFWMAKAFTIACFGTQLSQIHTIPSHLGICLEKVNIMKTLWGDGTCPSFPNLSYFPRPELKNHRGGYNHQRTFLSMLFSSAFFFIVTRISKQ